MRKFVVAISVVAVVVLVAGLAGHWVWTNSTASVPKDEPKVLVATIEVPTMTDEQNQQDPGVRTGCVTRIETAGGWLDLCWQAGRQADADLVADSYWVSLRGTLHGNSPTSGLHWMAIRADIVAPRSTVWLMDTKPGGTYRGDCTQEQLNQFRPSDGGQWPTVDVCGLTVVDAPTAGSTALLTWACDRCLLAMSGSQDFGMAQSWTVHGVDTPKWNVYAEIG
jgi:hypothetical protein